MSGRKAAVMTWPVCVRVAAVAPYITCTRRQRQHTRAPPPEQCHKTDSGWSDASDVVGLLQGALPVQFQHEIMRALALLIMVMLLLLPSYAAAGSASSSLSPQRHTSSFFRLPGCSKRCVH